MDDPPPLEDCSRLLERKKSQAKPVKHKAKTTVQNRDSSLLQHEAQPRKPASGLKAGFLNNPPKTSKNKKLVHVKASTKNPLVLDSVQSEMKKHMTGLLGNQESWLTSDLLDKIDSNPVLGKAFQDPEFERAAQLVAQDPATALKYYQQKRPDLIAALKEFIGLMGSRMQQGMHSDLDKKEQEIVDRVLKDGKVQAVLKDPLVQNILEMGRKGQIDEMNRMLYTIPGIHEKIQVLVSCGLMKFESR